MSSGYVEAIYDMLSDEPAYAERGHQEAVHNPQDGEGRRVKLEPVIMAEEPIQFKELIPKLKFIVNKERWTGHIRRAMRTIPKEDYDLIFSAVKGSKRVQAPHSIVGWRKYECCN